MFTSKATASVDTGTDLLIQETIRENFADRTVLCIAHRLDTIIDSDRVVVVGEGKILECDKPSALLANENSYFMKLASELGKDVLDNLKYRGNKISKLRSSKF